jgi:malic enzyme
MAKVTAEEALAYHLKPSPGKYKIVALKPLKTPHDLSLAYSPGVAYPVHAIAKSPDAAYDYTVKGNMVAVISNGTAILGLGNLGALASKPVMEGKAALFGLFADISAVDIELDSENVDELVRAIHLMHPTFGGINLEDIKAPECFVIEEQLKQLMDIPVFHDDQHGTAVVCAAGLINGLELAGKSIDSVKIVVNGAGAAGIACLKLLHAMGACPENTILCDSQGTVWSGRENGMNRWKSELAVETPLRTLTEALVGADVFIGVSVKDALTKSMLRSMASDPIIFALANPDPEITPERAREARSDAIVATGRSDYPNQVNNVLCFPYIFRGALDARAREINDEMKVACAVALAHLARAAVPESVKLIHGKELSFGRDYIIPSPFDPRLLSEVTPAVMRAAIKSGVARKGLNIAEYQAALRCRIN